MEWVVLFLVLVVFYTAFCNLCLCQSKEELRQQLYQAQADLDKLKLLNKLKVGWDGNPIVYGEGK